jgi:hypothetical protein
MFSDQGNHHSSAVSPSVVCDRVQHKKQELLASMPTLSAIFQRACHDANDWHRAAAAAEPKRYISELRLLYAKHH